MLCSRSHSTYKESGEEKITSGQETASAMPVHLQQCCVRSIKRNQDQGGRGDALGGSGAAGGKTGRPAPLCGKETRTKSDATNGNRPGEATIRQPKHAPRWGRLKAGTNRNFRVKRIAQRISKQSSP